MNHHLLPYSISFSIDLKTLVFTYCVVTFFTCIHLFHRKKKHMASSATRKQCEDVDGCKHGAVTICEGCSKAFCIKHFTDHRRLLDEEMNMIIDEHDLLKNSLNQQIIKHDSHPLIKQIDQWEKESIRIIQQRANELRQELLQSTNNYTDDLSKKLQRLSEKLREGRENNNFIETDLQVWKETLVHLKTDFTSPSTIFIKRV